MDIAASKEAAFRSGILVSAIFWTCSLVMVATLFLLGTPEALSMPQAFLMRTVCGRGLGDESERTILINGDHYGNDQAGVVLGSLVKVLGESHDVYTVLTESRANRGAGVALPAGI